MTIINGQGRVGVRVTGGSSPSSTLWNNLLSYYTGDNTPNDSKGSNNGTLINGATYGTGKINNGFSFDGINDYIQLPTNTFTPTGSYTISMWFNISSLGVNRSLFSIGNGTSAGIRSFINSTGKINFGVNSSNSTLSSNVTTTTGVWNHLVITCDTTTGFKMYVNGTLDKSNSVNVTPIWTATNNSVLGRYVTANYYFNGMIDEVGLWDGKSLTSTEVTELYNLGAGKQYPN